MDRNDEITIQGQCRQGSLSSLIGLSGHSRGRIFGPSTPDGTVWLPGASEERVMHGSTSADRDTERAFASLSANATNVLCDVSKIALDGSTAERARARDRGIGQR
jgi:hypothetical protein